MFKDKIATSLLRELYTKALDIEYIVYCCFKEKVMTQADYDHVMAQCITLKKVCEDAYNEIPILKNDKEKN